MQNTDFILVLKPKKQLKYTTHFADFETILVDGVHYVTCYCLYDSLTKTQILRNVQLNKELTNLVEASQQLVNHFIKDCFSCSYYKTKVNIVYFHNLGRFDGFFILKEIVDSGNGLYDCKIILRDNTIYEIVVTYNDKTIHFRDTLLLYPSSLSSFANLFNIPNKKEFDHENHTLDKYRQYDFLLELREYCRHDVYILKECFEKYNKIIKNNFKISLMDSLTLSSLAFKIFRKDYYTSTLIARNDIFIDQFIRQSYRGGICEVYKPILTSGYYYDVNSLYPYIMSTCDMPVGECTYVEHIDKIGLDFKIDNFFGFLEVEVTCPDNLYIPYLSKRDKLRGLISPVGKWTDVYFSEEIKYALTLGYQFKYIRGYKFAKREKVFTKYVDALYSLRIAHKGTSIDKVMKILLNSLYGRFGMSHDVKMCNIFDKNKPEKLPALDYLYDGDFTYYENKVLVKQYILPNLNVLNSISRYIDDKTYVEIMAKAEKNRRKLNIAVHIASAITAYARIYMHKFKMEYKDNLYYSDTDSLILDKEISEDLISDNKLGLFKLEGIVKSGIFVAPKLYYMELESEDVLKVKGVNKKYFSKNYFTELYNNSTPLEPINTERNFIRNFKDFSISKKNVNVSISGTFNKRLKIYKNTDWVNTAPIKL